MTRHTQGYPLDIVRSLYRERGLYLAGPSARGLKLPMPSSSMPTRTAAQKTGHLRRDHRRYCKLGPALRNGLALAAQVHGRLTEIAGLCGGEPWSWT
jgi:hypothetical protein